MAEMYECEPTTEEENLQVVDNMVENAHAAGNFVVDFATKIMRAVRQTPDQPPETEKEWAEVIIDWGLQFSFWWIWGYAMSSVCKTWFEAVRVELPEKPDDAADAFHAMPRLEWDCTALILFFVVSRWYRWQSKSMLLLFVGLMSMQLAYLWPIMVYVINGALPQVLKCWEYYTQTNASPTPAFCYNNFTEVQLFSCSYAYFFVVRLILLSNLVDMMVVVVVQIHTNNVFNC